jgi:tagatose 6-phosphate kinase
MIWCTLLNPTLDVTYTVSELQSGKTHIDCLQTQIPAGKGLNIVRVIRTLGEEVTVTGLLPEFDGKRVTAFLEDRSIAHHFFPVSGGMGVNATVVEDKTGDVTHIVAASPKVSSRIQHEFTTFAAQKMKSGDYWCFSGSIPQGFSDDAYSSFIKCGEEIGVKSVLDSQGAPLKRGIRTRPFMIKPNLSELEEFFEEQIKGVHHIALKGKRLMDMGVTYVFISLGEDGMIALHKNDCLLCNAPSIQVRDTNGCGDALVAGALVAIKRQFSFTEICRMAVACGSAKALHRDPGKVNSDNVWQLMEDVHITSV